MSNKNIAYYKVFDMTNHGRAKGTLMAVVYAEKNGEQLNESVESGDMRTIVESVQRIARRHGYTHSTTDQIKPEK